MRGAALALGALAVAGIVVLGVIWIPHGTSPPRLQLTLTKPYGGTIVGDGIECGTGGSDCNAEFREGERVELDTRADKGYAFTAFTGPCAPSGRVIINKALTCGAKFDRDDLPPPAATFPLTIEKPSGGTILVEPDIICGALQTMCSAKMAVGSHVKLNVQPEPGFVFLNFTNDCAPEGETTMSQARTCGATFGPAAPPRPPTPPPNVAARKTEGPRVSIEVPDKSGSTGAGQSTPGQNPAASSQGQQTPTSAQINPINPNPGPANQAVATSGSAPTNTGPVAAPITPEDHAKNEIQQLVKRYCDESQTLQPVRIKALYPQADLATMKDRFREYKSLQCTVAAPPEFERLDAREAGFAQVKFGMKQVIQMKSGGAPQTVETIVTMTVSRMDLQSPWLIDRLLHAPKPKP